MANLDEMVTAANTPSVIPRDAHCISRANISENSLKVLYRLKDAGYQAYLVGGGVRDLLLGREPKDFDIATDALPDQVRGLFRNCRLIGRRFRLAHVHFGRDIVEVATFRASITDAEPHHDAILEDGRIIRDNVYGSIEDDAIRRDFTINAMYYDIRDFSVVDYTSGLQDLQAGVIRIIGDPEVRFREDPVRMLRAVRFAAKLGFIIDPDAETALHNFSHLLADISAARIFDETLKLFHSGCGHKCFELLRHYGLFAYLFPAAEEALAHQQDNFPLTFIAHALRNTDDRINSDKSVTPAFLYAALLWEPLRERAAELGEEGHSEVLALQMAGREIISRQVKHTAIPKRFSVPMREIWTMQPRFKYRRGKRPMRLLQHPRFRAAYDFMCLRSRSDDSLKEDCDWWTQLQEVEQPEKLVVPAKRSRPRRRKPGRKPQHKST